MSSAALWAYEPPPARPGPDGEERDRLVKQFITACGGGSQRRVLEIIDEAQETECDRRIRGTRFGEATWCSRVHWASRAWFTVDVSARGKRGVNL